MVYELKLGDNAMEATKNICCVKGEGTVDYNTTKWFKKFCLGWKNLNDQSEPGRPKTMNSEVMLQDIETNRGSDSQESIRQPWHLTIQCGSSSS